MQLKESETLEFKKSTSELKEAVISIGAILNKHGKGELYFGIKNNGTVIGQDVGGKTLRDISKTISDYIEPKIYPKIKEEKIDNKNCVVVDFKGNNGPYYAYGRAYMRVADEDRLMSAKEVEKLILEKNKDKFEVEKTVGKTVGKIIRLIKENPNITREELADSLSLSVRGVEWNLAKLKQEGVIKRVGSAKGGHWEVTE